MGPTVIIPGSHFFSVDRAGHWTSEDRIQASAVPAPYKNAHVKRTIDIYIEIFYTQVLYTCILYGAGAAQPKPTAH